MMWFNVKVRFLQCSICQIKGFIQRTMGQFGKRSVKEIQAIWIARQNRLKQMNLMKSKQPEEEQQLPEGNRAALVLSLRTLVKE